VDLGIHADPIEQFSIAQWTVQVSLQNRSEIYGLLRFIIELHTQGVWSNGPKRLDSVDCMTHSHPFLLQWLYWQWALTSLQTLPIFHQLLLVQLGPGFDETPLAFGKRACHQLDRIYAIDRYLALVSKRENEGYGVACQPPSTYG
jgi:hypothetical protein